MDNKNYLLLARCADGYIHEKVNMFCDLHFAKLAIRMMMQSSPRLVRGEIIEGNRTHTGDFRVKPLVHIRRDNENIFSEEAS